VFAPVSILPPVFRSLGIPPANMPASCGGPPCDPSPSPPSLLLLPLDPLGGGGAKLPGGGLGAIPGIGGAEPILGAAGPFDTFPTVGAERSLTTVTFLSRVPS
jgi:hypothetical protein